MTKAQKIILLSAATLIISLIIFPPTHSDVFINKEIIIKEPVEWGSILLTALIAGAAFLIAGLRRPGGKE